MPATWIATEELELSTLRRFPGNAWCGDVEQIRESLRRNGQYRALVVRQHDGQRTILAGNHTADALEAEQHQTARCELIECSDAEARRINAADNRIPQLGHYNDQALTELLAGIDGDFDGTGWTSADLDELLAAAAEPEAAGNTDPDDAPPAPADPRSAPGDLYHIGEHRLIVGDCTDLAAVEAMLAGDRADCMWTDPPYGVEYTGKTRDALTIRNDGADDLPELLAGAYAVATAVLTPGAAIYVAHPAGALSKVFADAWFAAGWRYHEGLVWVKDQMVLGHSDYHYRHEPVMFGYTASNGRRGRGGDGWYGGNAETSVFEFAKPARSSEHPTMKPCALVQAHLANSCPPGGLVYEPFAGSGTTLIAAHRLGLRAAACELDPVYADVILGRLQRHTGIIPERTRADGTREPVSFA